MQTQFLTLDSQKFDPQVLLPVVDSLRKGGVVAFPTETVYGMGVHLEDPQAVQRLLELRKSPAERAITIHIADREDLTHYLSEGLPVMAQRLIRKHWPGPLTILVEEGGKTFGFRLPDHPVARALIREARIPIGAPSANYKGEPPATDAARVRDRFDGKIDWILDGGPCRFSTASTIVRVREKQMELVRENNKGQNYYYQ
ncbi:MAG: L-threonylcarbamoyladenylate synthase [Planctomycetota bacterium]|nr:L-threonylcarbamoyladenylate synthase [Planctomycetota bacterium]